MKTLMTRFAKDESGATAIEYGLIATLIGVAIIVGRHRARHAAERRVQGHLDQARRPVSQGRSASEAKAARPQGRAALIFRG